MFESNTRDLQTLEARVVINITEFYTYMKAFRDYLRTLAEITPQSDELESRLAKVYCDGTKRSSMLSSCCSLAWRAAATRSPI